MANLSFTDSLAPLVAAGKVGLTVRTGGKSVYGPGAAGYVRESVRLSYETPTGYVVEYADGALSQLLPLPVPPVLRREGWVFSRYMPKACARAHYQVTRVVNAKLHTMTDTLAKLAGLPSLAAYRELWDQLNALRGYAWDTNPEVAFIYIETRKP